MAESNPCFGEQEDELLALSAIFGEDFSKTEYEDCSTIYEIKIKVNLVEKNVQLRAWLPVEEEDGDEEDGHEDEKNPEGVSSRRKILFRRSESKQHSCLLLSVFHLVPLRLEFSFPDDYPVSSKPLFTLSCLWLDSFHLTKLCQKLDNLWELSFKGQTVIFSWVDWLQNSSLEFLGANESISLKPYEWDMDDPSIRDPRGLPEFIEPKSCALKILEYNFQMEQQQFRKESHICEICFEEREGILFHFLDECSHMFCVECLLDYCQMHVNEGTVRQLKCPERDCQSALSPIILRELLSVEDFERWERLLFQQTLDGMSDVLYCPRCNTVVVHDEDEESKLAQCRECFFSFCTECQMGWHSTQPCGNDGEENLATSPTKPNEKRRKPKKQVDELDEMVTKKVKKKTFNPTLMNYSFLMLQKRLGNYQRCPKCRIMVEKTAGCNMMVCSRCRQMFCWTCGKKISGYNHFSSCGENAIQARGRGMLDNRPVAPENLRINEALVANPDARRRLRMCPRCRQRNMKENRNNHMKCWACKTDFCYQCVKQITPPLSVHFKVAAGCQQHSDD